MTQPDYGQLYDLIEAHTGLTLDENKRKDIQRVVEPLLAAEGLADVHSLNVLLDDLPLTDDKWRLLTQTVTIGETYFFRNRAHFNALRDRLLPDLIAGRRASGFKRLRIWSAGCASGEEPYSIAILLRELLPDLPDWDITILGTDLNVDALDRARKGLYRASAFRNETPDYLQDRWFRPVGDQFELDQVIREMVLFKPLNLVADDYPSFDSGTMGIDLLICRNVTIYFGAETTRAIVRRFFQAIVEDGWLIVGHSEPVAETYQTEGFVPRNFTNAVFYQKSAAAAENMPLPWWTAPPPAETPRRSPPPPPAQSHSLEEILARTRPKVEPKPARQSPPAEPPPAPPNGPAHGAAAGQAAEADIWQQAKAAADRGRLDDALALIDRAEGENPMLPQVHYLRALVLLQQDEADRALHALRRAIYCDPDFALAHYSLGELYARRREHRLAFRHWRLAEKAIGDLAPSQQLLLAEDLTVDILRALLTHQIGRLPASIVEDHDVPL